MKRWYVIHVISGKEEVVKEKIQNKIEENNLFKFFGKLLIPYEEVVEIKFGKKEKSKRFFFPGYVLIDMSMNYKTWLLVKNTTYVINFVGSNSSTPIPIKDTEMTMLLEKINESFIKPKPKKVFKLGERIRVIDGPFSDFNGTVEEINYSKNKLCVGVLIFGRSTPIDLYFNQVEKV